MAFSLKAFNWLHSRRFTEMGVAAISFRHVLDYLEFFDVELDLEEREELMFHIVAMEAAYSKFQAKKKDQKTNVDPGKPPQSKH